MSRSTEDLTLVVGLDIGTTYGFCPAWNPFPLPFPTNESAAVLISSSQILWFGFSAAESWSADG